MESVLYFWGFLFNSTVFSLLTTFSLGAKSHRYLQPYFHWCFYNRNAYQGRYTQMFILYVMVIDYPIRLKWKTTSMEECVFIEHDVNFCTLPQIILMILLLSSKLADNLFQRFWKRDWQKNWFLRCVTDGCVWFSIDICCRILFRWKNNLFEEWMECHWFRVGHRLSGRYCRNVHCQVKEWCVGRIESISCFSYAETAKVRVALSCMLLWCPSLSFSRISKNIIKGLFSCEKQI